MQFLEGILPFIQIGLSVLLITTIILQQTEASLGEAFGGSGATGGHTRRGPEKILFQATVILGILFVATTVVALVI